ncbi:hypothetical protein GJ496_002436 [Pomphorhynchus laevis]|nr:hypothetical protein GJ496_002436 [Pomphorhynchus laevis]
MQRVREQNHEVSQFVNNPDLMCQTMEMIRIPTTIQEITRNHDRALINLERLPSGYKVRQRIYRDFQEPMLNVAHEQFGDNPLNTYSSSSGTANTSQVGTENTNLLPNPAQQMLRYIQRYQKGNINDEHQDQSSDVDTPTLAVTTRTCFSSVDKHVIQDRDAELVIVLVGTVERLYILQLCASRDYNK